MTRAARIKEHEGPVRSPEHARRLMLAGDATLTVRNPETLKHFTFRVTRAPDDHFGNRSNLFFFSVLRGADNESDFRYMGTIHPFGDDFFRYQVGRKTKVADTDTAWVAWEWFYRQTQSINSTFPPSIEILHAGRCCVCGRKLTNPESVLAGIGPECATKE